MTPLISVIDPEGPPHWFNELKKLGDVTFSPAGFSGCSETNRSLVSRSTAVVITSATAIDAELMDCAPHLRIIAKCGGVPSNVDIEAATQRTGHCRELCALCQ